MRTGFIDWTEKQIDLYVFEQQEHVDTITVPAGDELSLSSLTAFLKAGLDQIYLSVPLLFLTLRELTFPFSDKVKIKDTLSYELEGLLLGSVSGYAIDHIVTETYDGGCRVLAVCIDKTQLRKIINSFFSAGLEPKVITSIDIQLSGGDIGKLVEGAGPDREARVGAAEREVMDPTINLRQDELAYTGDIERMQKVLRVTASLLLALVLMLGAHAAFEFVVQKRVNNALNNELLTIYRNAFPEDKKIVDPVKQFQGNLSVLREKKSLLGGMPVLDILYNVATLKNRNTTLNEFSADGKNLIMKGTASSFEEVDSLKNALSASFDGVKVVNSDAAADKRINFTLLMQERSL
jgi:type II secretory pathway component PulL